MTFWRLEYFEGGSPNAYVIETYFRLEERDAAVARYLRLGGDDILKITSKNVLETVLAMVQIFALKSTNSK